MGKMRFRVVREGVGVRRKGWNDVKKKKASHVFNLCLTHANYP
jgi:hypothetical protein